MILEELRMHDDEPEDVVQDVFTDAVFPDHPIGREVIGSTETIESMHRPEIADFHASHYHPSNVVVAAAGNLEHERVIELLEAGLNSASGTRPPRDGYTGNPPPARWPSSNARPSRPTWCSACGPCATTTPTGSR